MIFLKYFNRFLIAGLVLAGQMPSLKAYNTKKVNQEITRINSTFGNDLKLDLSNCEITSNDLPDILTSINTEKRDHISHLTLWTNQITALPSDFSTLLPNLNSINLGKNLLGKNTKSLLCLPITLVKVNLDNNELTELPQNFVTQLKNLQIIQLNDNPDLNLQPTVLTEFLTSNSKTLDITRTAQETYINQLFAENLQSNNEQDQNLLNFLAAIGNSKKTLMAKLNFDLKTFARTYKICHDEINDLQNSLQKEIAGRNQAINNLCNLMQGVFENDAQQ